MYIQPGRQFNALNIVTVAMGRLGERFGTFTSHWRATSMARTLDQLDDRTRYDTGFSDISDSGVAALVRQHPAVIATNPLGFSQR